MSTAPGGLTTLPVLAVAAAVGGAALGAELAARGLRQLDHPDPAPRWFAPAARISGAVGGAAAVVVAGRANEWWILPGLLVWAYVLCAAACCDALTQRVPTQLVRQGGSAAALLLVVGAAISRDWRALLVAAVAVTIVQLAMLILWRFAGAGFGDVRLAALGGLGLGHVAAAGVALGLLAFVVVSLGQVIVVFARGGDRRTMLPYGPALAVTFLLAAAVASG